MTLTEQREARHRLILELADQIRDLLQQAGEPMDLPDIELDIRLHRRNFGLPWKELWTFDFRDAIAHLIREGKARYGFAHDVELIKP